MDGKLAVALLSLAVLSVGAPGARAGYSQLLVFGDSLSDNGNDYIASSGAVPQSPPYVNGRFSNGPVWIETLAGRLGLPLTPSLQGGTDYAFGGAESSLSGLSFRGTPNVGTQLGMYFSNHSTVDPAALVVLWAGANDFLNAGVTDPTAVVNNLAAEITMLVNAGAHTFLVPNLPLLGNVPLTPTTTAAQRQGLNLLSQAYDTLLDARLNQLQGTLGVTIFRVDVAGLVSRVQANPGAYGFTNATTAALDDGVTGGAGYMFWDAVHPTTAAHGDVASLAATAVPEPSSFALTALAGGLLLARFRRRAA